MAYKFQLGAAKLGGKVTAAGLDAGDADIDNVADIAVDSISADGNDITVVATNNRGAAFQVSCSAAGPIFFADTTTGQESAFAPKGLAVDMDGEVKVRSNSGRMELHVSGAAYPLMELGDIQIDVNQKIRMSGSQGIEFADNQHKLVKNGATMELYAANAKRLTAKNGGVDIEGALHADTLDIVDPTSLAGAALVRNGTTLDVGVDGTGIEINSDALRLKDGGVTADKMANLAATKLYVGNGSNRPVAVSLSGDVTMDNAGAVTIAANAVQDGMINDDVAAGLAGNGLDASSGVMSLDLKSNSGLIIDSTELAVDLDSDALQFASGKIDLKDSIAGARTFQSNLTVNGTASIGGDLIVQGTTVTLDVATIGITGSFSFEGATADAHETTLGVVDPTGDRSLLLPNIDGNIGAFSHASWQTARSTITVSELDLQGAGAGSSVAVAAGDGIVMYDATDSNAAKKVLMSDIKTYIGSGISAVAAKADGDTLVVGVNYMADMGSDGQDTLTLPASPAIGESVMVKAPSDCSSARYVTIQKAGSQTIDGQNDIKLESPFAAVELVYVANNTWRVF